MKRIALPIVALSLALAPACGEEEGTCAVRRGPRDRVLTDDDSHIAPTKPPDGTDASSSAPLPAPLQGAVVRAPARPLSGGTLAITSDGTVAIAADPDRAAIFVVDLATRAVRTITTEPDDEVGRVVEGPPGHAFVAARRGGVVFDVDLRTATALRIPVCRTPRGLAYSAGALHVACASGALLTLDTATRAITQRRSLDADLRDVVVVGEQLAVTRFLAAELLMVDTKADAPPAKRGAILASSLQPGAPTVAYRAIAGAGRSVVVSHQAVPATSNAYYNLSSFACAGAALVRTVVSVVHPEEPQLGIQSIELGGGVLPVDVAAFGSRLAVVSGGQVRAVPVGGKGCNTDPPLPAFANAEIVAVAARTGGLVAQSREPAKLMFETGEPITLSEVSHDSTGFALFHASVGDGIACASCHPEGGDDGRLWRTAKSTERLSQPLYAGAGRATPYHWDGEVPTFTVLLDQVMIERMGGKQRPTREQEEAFVDWLDTIRAPIPAEDLDAVVVARGATAFQEKGCAGCHTGALYTDHAPHDVGTGPTMITPSLVGVGSRSAFTHDGCARSLRTLFGSCGGTEHAGIDHMNAATRDDLIAFLRSL